MDQLTLFELNQLIRATLDTHLEPSYWVIAEIGSLQVNKTGHCYLELVQKEDEQMKAKIRATIWSYNYRKLGSWFEAITGMPLKTGIKVLLNVAVQFHELYGLSLNVRDIDPNFTLGERARKRQEIINRLRSEGLFDRNKSTFLPLAPQRIAIISSSTAAGYDDFVNQIRDNIYGYTFNLTLFNSIMQGYEAEKSIIKSLDAISIRSEYFDVIVIIRGGGSQVDLDCFDGYKINKSIASMSLPVITGIGHERDESIADMVAHTHLKTPTAVSDFFISGFIQFDGLLQEYTDRIKRKFEKLLYSEETRLRNFHHTIQKIVASVISKQVNNHDNALLKLKNTILHYFENHYLSLEHKREAINLIHPDNVLRRGYTLTMLNGKILRADSDISVGELLKTLTRKHVISSKITSLEKRNDKKET